MKKKLYSYFFGLFCACLVVWACDNNDIDIDIKYLFSPEVETSSKGTVDSPQDLKIKITSTVYKENLLDHNVQFTNDKKSKLISPQGDTLESNKFFPVKYDGEWHTYKFIGKEVGTHNLNFLFKNSKDFNIEVKKQVQVDYAGFNFTAVASNIGSVNVPKEITITLEQPEGAPKNSSYKISYIKENILGVIKNESGVVVKDGEANAIKPGVYKYTFTPSSNSDTAKLIFTVVDNYGQKKDAVIDLKIASTGFTFDIIPSSEKAYLNENSAINFKISPIDASTVSKYKMRFTTSGQGTLGGNTSSDNYFDVQSGDFVLNYKGLNVGDHTVTVSVKDDYGSVITKDFKISIVSQIFDFTAAADNTSAVINEKVNINANIASLATSQTYQLKYEVVQGSGVLYDNGIALKQNQLISVNKGAFTKVFQPTSGGSVTLRLTVINSDGYEQSKDIVINTSVPEFTFTASALQTSQSLNESNKINYALAKIGTSPQTYQIKFEDSGESKINGFEKNVWFDINEGNGSLNFVPSSSGTHSIKLTVKSKEYGVEMTQSLAIEVGLHAFDFAVSDANTGWNIQIPQELVFSINPIGADQGQNYSMTYAVTGGQATVEGFSPNIYNAVTKGSFKLKVTPLTSGTVSLKFSVKNTDGTVKEQSIDLKVNSADYTFTTTAQQSTTTLGNPITVSYSLIPSTGSTQTYQVKFDGGSSEGTLNGYQKGVWFDVSANSNGTFTYSPNNVGNHAITVTARSNFGVEKSATFNVNVSAQNFDFTAATSSGTGTINTPIAQQFTISSIGNDSGQQYQMQFMNDSGSGTLNGNQAGAWFAVNKGNFSMNYVPTSQGAHKISYKVRNTAGTEITKTVEITVTQPDFTITANPVKATSIINESVDVNFALNNLGDDLNTTYQMQFVDTNQKSTIGGNQQGQWFTVSKGNFTLPFVGLSSGDHNIVVKVKNGFNVEKTATFKITVANYDFAFTAVATNANPIVNEATPINMNIAPTGNDAGQTYMIKYEVLQGGATVEGLSPGVYSLTSKGNFSHNVKATSSGQVSIKFTTQNSAGATHEQTISLNVGTPDYTFTTTAQQSATTLGNPITVSYSLLPSMGSTQTYQVKFDGGSSEGTLNGNQKGVWFDVPSTSNGTFTYNPSNIGSHNITVTVRSNYGVEKTSVFNVNVSAQSFDFTAIATELTMNTGQPSPTNFNITPIGNDSGITYQMKYVVNSGSALVDGYSPNVYSSVSKGNYTAQITAQSGSNLSITFTVKNSAGVEISKTVNWSINTPDFNFTSTLINNGGIINENIPVNFDISPIGNDFSTNYQMSFSVSNGTGTLDGHQSGTWFAVNKGNFNLNYNSNTVGSQSITVTVKNGFGVTKTSTYNLSILNPEFSFTAIAMDQNLYANDKYKIALDITPIASNTQQTFDLKYEVLNGAGSVEGITNSSYVTYNAGSSNLNFIPTSFGNVTVQFTVRNSYGVTKTQTINISVNERKITISSGNLSLSTVATNEPFSLSGIIVKTPFQSNNIKYKTWISSASSGNYSGINSTDNVYADYTLDGSGGYTLNLTALSEGDYQYNMQVQDEFGNVSNVITRDIKVLNRLEFVGNPTGTSVYKIYDNRVAYWLDNFKLTFKATAPNTDPFVKADYTFYVYIVSGSGNKAFTLTKTENIGETTLINHTINKKQFYWTPSGYGENWFKQFWSDSYVQTGKATVTLTTKNGQKVTKEILTNISYY